MRTDSLLLGDVLEAIDEVLSTTPSARATFDADKLVRSHVVRNIQIIGEAVTRLSAERKARHPEVPWRAIAGMRHVIIHSTSRSTGTRCIEPLATRFRRSSRRSRPSSPRSGPTKARGHDPCSLACLIQTQGVTASLRGRGQ